MRNYRNPRLGDQGQEKIMTNHPNRSAKYSLAAGFIFGKPGFFAIVRAYTGGDNGIWKTSRPLAFLSRSAFIEANKTQLLRELNGKSVRAAREFLSERGIPNI